jgi:hypothetical protein
MTGTLDREELAGVGCALTAPGFGARNGYFCIRGAVDDEKSGREIGTPGLKSRRYRCRRYTCRRYRCRRYACRRDTCRRHTRSPIRRVGEKAAQQHGSDHTWRAALGDGYGQVRPGVLAEQHDSIGVDAQIARVTARECHCRPHVVCRVGHPQRSMQPVVDGHPRIPGRCEQLEELADERHPRARSEAAAVNHDYCRRCRATAGDASPASRGRRRPRIEHQVATLHAPVHDAGTSPRNDVVAVRIGDGQRQTGRIIGSNRRNVTIADGEDQEQQDGEPGHRPEC